MLRDSVALAGAVGRLHIAAVCAAAAFAMVGCGIKGPLRLPSPPPAPATTPTPATTPASPTMPESGSPLATEPDQAPPKKP